MLKYYDFKYYDFKYYDFKYDDFKYDDFSKKCPSHSKSFYCFFERF